MGRFLFALLGALTVGSPAVACGAETDCELGARHYRISVPSDRGDAPIGALIYAHGYRGSAKGAMKNKALTALAHANGLALVALKSASQDWLIPGVPENPAETGAKEFDYIDAVIADLEVRHGIDPDRLIATGFSAGGMMIWNLACHRGDRFQAFVPVAGTFWAEVPKDCPSGAVNLIHIHGTSDKIVPLTGRSIAQTRQGNVFEALEMLGQIGSYGGRQPVPGADDLTCAARESPEGKVLGFCTHPGGHSFRASYLGVALEDFRSRGLLPPPE